MAYDPADLKLPGWLLAAFNFLIRVRFPLAPSWQFGFTRPGILFSAVLLGVWAAALYSGNNLLYLCGAILLVMAVAAAAYGVRLLRRLPPMDEWLPQAVNAGEVYVARRRLDLPTPLWGMVQLRWQEGIEATLCSNAGQATFRMRLPPLMRGVYTFRQVQLASEAPLGLWRLQCKRPMMWQLAVLPQPIPWLGAGTAAGRRALGVLPGDEWRDLRPYVRGDQPSRIHWRKVTQGDWAVKRFVDPLAGEEAALLRVDLRADPGYGFERLLGMAHAWMRTHPQGSMILGQKRFDLAESDQYRAAQTALAGAVPEKKASCGQRRHAAYACTTAPCGLRPCARRKGSPWGCCWPGWPP